MSMNYFLRIAIPSIMLAILTISNIASADDEQVVADCRKTLLFSATKTSSKTDLSGELVLKILNLGPKFSWTKDLVSETQSMLASPNLDNCAKYLIIKQCKNTLIDFDSSGILNNYQEQCNETTRRLKLENDILEVYLEVQKAYLERIKRERSRPGSGKPVPPQRKPPVEVKEVEITKHVLRTQTNLCLDARDANRDSVQHVKAYPCDGSMWQQWIVRDNHAIILFNNQEFCLYVDGVYQPGKIPRLYACRSDATSWMANNGQSLIVSGLCLSVIGKSIPGYVRLENCNQNAAHIQYMLLERK